MNSLDSICNYIKNVVFDCGKLIDNVNQKNLKIKAKEGNNNIVTNYDILVQEKLKKELLNLIPNAAFMGEENDSNRYQEKEYIFIVDPIDGTTNFSRNMNMSAISVALLKNDEPVVGVCYNPYSNEMYSAIKGKGAYLNDKPIRVSSKTLKEGIVICGSASYYSELKEKTIRTQNSFFEVASDYRRFGAAVIDICFIASGKAEVFFELRLMPWDYAAASLILKEAGGKIATIEGNDIQYMKPTSILASNDKEDYLKYIK